MKRFTIPLLLLLLATFAAACDPLAAEAGPLIVQVTATAIPATRPPTATAIPTATETPPTETPIPTLAPLGCAETAGKIVKDAYQSKQANAQVAYQVYLPPCYWSSARRYPSLLLLHGSDTDQNLWTDTFNITATLDSGIVKGTLPPMIVIMPSGGDLANTNVFRGRSYELLLLNELLPTLDSSLCTWAVREGRAIGGISRGGFWAYLIGLRHPDQFGAIGGHSAFFDPNNAAAEFNPLSLARTMTFTPGQQPRLWMDAGKDDYARPNIELFVKSLKARNIDPGYTMYPTGQHNAAYWGSHIADYLTFYGATWPRRVQDLPGCGS